MHFRYLNYKAPFKHNPWPWNFTIWIEDASLLIARIHIVCLLKVPEWRLYMFKRDSFLLLWVTFYGYIIFVKFRNDAENDMITIYVGGNHLVKERVRKVHMLYSMYFWFNDIKCRSIMVLEFGRQSWLCYEITVYQLKNPLNRRNGLIQLSRHQWFHCFSFRMQCDSCLYGIP